MTMTLTRENIQGWFGSILLHALLLLILFLTALPEITHKQEFIEVSWGATAERPQLASQAVPQVTGAIERSISNPSPSQRASSPIVLPERKIPDPSNDFLSVPQTDKLQVTGEAVSGQRTQTALVGEREGRISREMGQRERDVPGTLGINPGESAARAGTGLLGSNIDRGVSFSVDWLQGRTRRKLSGDLPKYPEGVNVEAQIKLMTDVLPDGSIKGVQPVQKGNTRLEEAAMKEVRLWWFEPLKSSQPQVEQSCVITFLFKLK